jgi:hypothetical protein
VAGAWLLFREKTINMPAADKTITAKIAYIFTERFIAKF